MFGSFGVIVQEKCAKNQVFQMISTMEGHMLEQRNIAFSILVQKTVFKFLP